MKGTGYTTVIVLLLAHAALGADDCKGEFTKDRDVEPIYLQDGDHSVLNYVDGSYLVKNGERVIVACPGSSKMFDTLLTTDIELEDGTDSFLATCNNGKMIPSILGVQRVFELGQWQCENILDIDAHPVKECETGCQETFVDSGFDAQYRVTTNLTTVIRHTAVGSCYNNRTESVLFSKHTWNRGKYIGRSSNSWDSIFHDRTALDQLYGDHSGLDRGHLAPDADFQNKALQRLTYYYHNAAPQLSAVNSGIWRTIERKIRITVELADIYTGTSDGEEKYASGRPEYLDNEEELVRVPDFFWKLVFPMNLNESIDFGFVVCNKKEERIRNRRAIEFFKNYPCPAYEQLEGKGSEYGLFCFAGADVRKISYYLPEASDIFRKT